MEATKAAVRAQWLEFCAQGQCPRELSAPGTVPGPGAQVAHLLTVQMKETANVSLHHNLIHDP